MPAKASSTPIHARIDELITISRRLRAEGRHLRKVSDRLLATADAIMAEINRTTANTTFPPRTSARRPA